MHLSFSSSVSLSLSLFLSLSLCLCLSVCAYIHEYIQVIRLAQKLIMRNTVNTYICKSICIYMYTLICMNIYMYMYKIYIY